jgi:hypothetical protein
MLLVVPLGSVPGAVAPIQDRPGVQFVSANLLLFASEDEPAFIQDCGKTQEAGE